MKCSEIEREMQQRADLYRHQNFLHVDYYRIRRQLAYPLPIRQLATIPAPIPGIPLYPWSIWLMWALEERINTLAWVTTKQDDAEVRALVERDLMAMAAWPVYRELGFVDLCLGHASRLLAKAHSKWTWLSEECRESVRAALGRIVEDETPGVRERYGAFSRKDDIIAHENTPLLLANIPFIGTVGVALAANALDHPTASTTNNTLHILIEALLEARQSGTPVGHSEGACYDGYMLDFIVEWLAVQPASIRESFFAHPQFETYLDECYRLNAPGSSWNIARLGDVEPIPSQMPFHTSAQAKLLVHRPTPVRAWYINRFAASSLRADALATLYELPEDKGVVPAAGVQDALYAIALRDGWERDNVAVAIAASNSPAGHLHTNNGSINIGTRESWFITTPGYQQYMKNSEREFVLGVTSRNTPTINGQSQTTKAVRILSASSTAPDAYETTLDLTACYAPELGLTKVQRRVVLHPCQTVTIEDTIEGEAIDDLTYYWNGHPESAWWIENDWASLHRKGAILWFTCAEAAIEPARLQRSRGSRGELTLVAPVDAAMRTIRWFFQFSDQAPTTEYVAEAFAKLSR